ncbi:MAG: histidine--tRNA ligase [Lachnospiraceae bacterium]|uniref:histidine--tRNA ligase n=1 Tax=uncultured Acetatifactor sp. TaxID=1671927 RepID=UPI0026251749|nr:histidine--tRNA ligase [uncultured Acetatifactor sp.]MCI8790442.1 histidine--tRNA ligase [Lachnospiraceae bacterium]
MALSKKPTTGMRDILPEEMQIREYVSGVIRDTYGKFGFTSIETPCVENIANLTNKQGGDNEKLIFKILKRGEKLNVAEAATEEEVVDGGLRYDLTVPLVRYYSNNAAQLPSPFKALQMGNVWRADRPQRGRFRQFMQCDIDILGEASNLAEIELILATTTTLGRLGFQDFEIRINDRQLLKAMAMSSGFAEEACDSVFITLDKMDKIGMDGVEAELLENGFEKEAVDRYLELYRGLEQAGDGVAFLAEKLAGNLEPSVTEGLREIIDSVNAAKTASFKMVFDPTLVRGMSYYTGTIFEVAIPGFGGSCGGGGRYDRMVGKFTGKDVPACGFSIGFERIIMLLLESGFRIPDRPRRIAYLVEKGVDGQALCDVIARAQAAREEGMQVLVVRMNKNKKFQKEQLEAQGYEEFVEFYKEALKN